MSSSNRAGPLRVLVVDDSAFNRRSISEILTYSADVEVVGKAADGEEALRLLALSRPDAITLDLEMPRMDGFTFLRILMSKTPTPVIVVSSYAQKENVFKALELGAIDFVAKPDRYDDAELKSIRDELLQKVLLVRSLRSTAVAPRPRLESRAEPQPAPIPTRPVSPRFVVAIGSSTGGPTALLELFGKVPRRTHLGFLIAQHMPEKFTRTFAERLDRRGSVRVTEAQDNDVLFERTAFVCPGRRSMQLSQTPEGDYKLRVVAPHPDDRYVPSVDRLFSSVARVAGDRALGIILTGMGDDGVRGAREILDRGGTVIAESERTAVVYGMPGAAVRAGAATRSLGLTEIAQFLANLG